MRPIKDSEKKLLSEQKDIAENLKQTFVEVVHLKNYRFDEDHCQKNREVSVNGSPYLTAGGDIRYSARRVLTY